MCSFGYFGTTHGIENINLISSKNAQKFYVEKDAIREQLDFQLKHASGTELKCLIIKFTNYCLHG